MLKEKSNKKDKSQKKKQCKNCASCRKLGTKFNKLIIKPTQAISYSEDGSGFVKSAKKSKRNTKKNLPAEKLYYLEIGASENLHTGKQEPIRMGFNKEFAELMIEGKAPATPLLGDLNNLGLKKKKKTAVSFVKKTTG